MSNKPQRDPTQPMIENFKKAKKYWEPILKGKPLPSNFFEGNELSIQLADWYQLTYVPMAAIIQNSQPNSEFDLNSKYNYGQGTNPNITAAFLEQAIEFSKSIQSFLGLQNAQQIPGNAKELKQKIYQTALTEGLEVNPNRNKLIVAMLKAETDLFLKIFSQKLFKGVEELRQDGYDQQALSNIEAEAIKTLSSLRISLNQPLKNGEKRADRDNQLKDTAKRAVLDSINKHAAVNDQDKKLARLYNGLMAIPVVGWGYYLTRVVTKRSFVNALYSGKELAEERSKSKLISDDESAQVDNTKRVRR